MHYLQMLGHSGDSAEIPLVSAEQLPKDAGERYKVIAKMNLCSQMAFSGDYTLEAIEKAVDSVAECDAGKLIIAEYSPLVQAIVR